MNKTVHFSMISMALRPQLKKSCHKLQAVRGIIYETYFLTVLNYNAFFFVHINYDIKMKIFNKIFVKNSKNSTSQIKPRENCHSCVKQFLSSGLSKQN